MAFRIQNIFSNYLRYNEINDYLDYLQSKFPEIVTVKTEGYSYEGRPLKTIKISSSTRDISSINNRIPPGRRSQPSISIERIKSVRKKNSPQSASNDTKLTVNSKNNSSDQIKKSIVLIDGGLHAREWISIAAAIYCIYQLTDNLNEHRQLLNQFEFIIFPVVNADGYEYTHLNNRFWRKNRKPITGFKSTGVDCNRNFSYFWNPGARKPSSETFHGLSPFSEPETIVLKNVLDSIRSSCVLYLSLHAHAQALMYPWGHTNLPEKWHTMHRLAEVGCKAIKRATGTNYRCGNISLLIRHRAAGSSPDYALGVAKIPFAMAMELSGGCFNPPKHKIKELVHECWIGVRAMCSFIASRLPNTNQRRSAI